ncbi:hypothetical protein, conserved [Leishmania lindenbergi]|uniref:BAR domain-containing protein n=1 Tax=Leishmania lindenbergi TaxID=651832 RepID=A0AAW3AF89_9TRYP
MLKISPADEKTVLIKKLKHACTSYDAAVKKYLAAVKGLDSTMEALAISLRELSQEEDSELARNRVDRFCTAVDRHMANASVGASGHNKPHPTSDEATPSSAGYPFANYMSDLTREATMIMDEFKEMLRTAEKSKSKQDDLVSKYNKKRLEVDELELKLAKKNQGIDSNSKFASKVADRDALKAQVEAGKRAFSSTYSVLLQKRTEVLTRVVDSLQMYSAKYYISLSKTMQA